MPPDNRPIAAVTGASRGIGRATALLLARAGYRMFALARNEVDLHSLVDETAAIGGEIVPVAMDIADDASRRAAVAAIMDQTDGYGLDLLVNNAGYGLLGPVEDVSAEQFRNQLEVNVVGLLAFTQSFLPAMRSRGNGRVIQVSSAAGRIATPFMGAYSSSKFALEGLSDAMRAELRPFGIRVILIEPGPVRTQFGQAAVRPETDDSPYSRFERRWQLARGGSDIFERPAESVARVILRAARTAHPRPRYTVTVSAKVGTVARRLVPDVVIDWFFQRAMRW